MTHPDVILLAGVFRSLVGTVFFMFLVGIAVVVLVGMTIERLLRRLFPHEEARRPEE